MSKPFFRTIDEKLVFVSGDKKITGVKREDIPGFIKELKESNWKLVKEHQQLDKEVKFTERQLDLLYDWERDECIICKKRSKLDENDWCSSCRDADCKNTFVGDHFYVRCVECLNFIMIPTREADFKHGKYYKENHDICGVHFYVALQAEYRCPHCSNVFQFTEKVKIGIRGCNCNFCRPIGSSGIFKDHDIPRPENIKLDENKEPTLQSVGCQVIVRPRFIRRGTDFQWIIDQFGETTTEVEIEK